MDDQKLDSLLNAHFARSVPEPSLSRLQRGVWQGIAARERPPLLTRLLGGIALSGELRAGPAFAAMVIGIGLGYATLDLPSAGESYAQAEGLGFSIFSTMSSHPLLKANL